MALSYHPIQKSIVVVNFDGGFNTPEMVKRRLAIVLSPAIRNRVGLCTVVPLSTTAPNPVMPYHYLLSAPFYLPSRWGSVDRWVKGDMVCAVSQQRLELLRLSKDVNGKRVYQVAQIPDADFVNIQKCVLHGLGMSQLTKLV
jgi:mRNA interferase MazF